MQALRQAIPTAEEAVRFSADMAPETIFLSGDEARELEPDLSPAIAGALLSPSTGIVDSHALMQSLETNIVDDESGNGSLAYSTRVVRVDPHPEGFVVQIVTSNASSDSSTSTSETTDAILTRALINSSGLSANLIWNSLRPDSPLAMYFARGSYASYSRKTGAR